MPAEMIGSADDAVVLAADSATVGFQLERPLTLDAGAGADRPPRYYLKLDNVTADGPPSTSYKVILDMGSPDDPTDDFVVGVAGFFGVERASSVDDTSMPHGLSAVFDITTVVDKLKARGAWDDTRAVVSFEPLEPVEDTVPTRVNVGSVTIFME